MTTDDNTADPFELPPPVQPKGEAAATPNAPRQETGEQIPEIMPAQPSAGPPPAQAHPVQPPVVTPPDPATPAPIAAPTDPASAGLPQIADDVDLIEKEWVEKAKDLINKTKDDPYTQNKEINKFKAGYIKKRYNKEVQT